jgi:hypothetical protein
MGVKDLQPVSQAKPMTLEIDEQVRFHAERWQQHS